MTFIIFFVVRGWFLYFFLFLPLVFVNAQHQELPIKEIRQKYNVLHQQLSFPDSTEKDLNASSEGATLTGYYNFWC